MILQRLQPVGGLRDDNDVLIGNQYPRIRSVPEYNFSTGVEAIELARHAGLILDPWQELAVMDIMGEDDEGLYAAFEAAIIVARQNGKGSILEALELAWLFLMGDRLIIHTAHEFKTAAEGYLRIKMLIENTPDLHRQVKQYHGSHGEEGITLKSGQRLRFLARSKGAGRGFTADKLIYDEAYELPAASVAASLPTLSARPNPQVIYTSSAPLESSLTLKAIRARGMHGKDADGNQIEATDWATLAYLEWSADPEGYDVGPDGKRMPLSLDDRRGWSDANPGLGMRIRESFIIKERAAMTDLDFGRERDGLADDPKINAVINSEIWDKRRDNDSVVNDPVAFAFDSNPEGTWATISVAGRRSDGRIHTEVVDRQRGLKWLVDRLVGLVEDWEPKFVIVDAMSPAASLIPDLAERGIEVVVTSTRDYGRACVKFIDLYESDMLRHPGQTVLTSATEIATKRILQADTGLWGWARRDAGDISPLVASTLAIWGYYLTAAEPEENTDTTVLVLRR